MLKVWGRADSSNVQAVMWCIGELGLEVERVDIGHRFGGTDTPDFLALNPNGTIPVLTEDGEAPIWESGAIVRHLARKHGGGESWPTSLADRARVDQWAEWAKINIAMNFTGPVFWRTVRTAPSKRDPAAIRAALHILDHYLDIAEGQISRNPFLAGETFSPADIQFGHVLYRYFDIDIERPAREHLDRYYRGLLERPPFRQHVMVSYEDLRVHD